MANEILENQSLPPAEAPAVAANLDAELDAALGNAFPSLQTPPEPKANEKVIEKSEPKQKTEKSPEAAKPVEEPKPVSEPKGDLPDPEAIDQNPPKKSGTQSKEEGWNALRNNYKKAHRLSLEKDEEVKKLKATLAEKGTLTQKEVEALKAQIQELSKYRAMVDIQADPEFISKFDNPINEKVQAMKDLLKGWNISDEIINQINFLDKNSVGAVAKALRKGEEHIHSEFELEEFMSNAKEVLELTKTREKEFKSKAENYKELLEAKKKESFSRNAEEEGKLYKHLDAIASVKDVSGNSLFPFLSKQEPKEGADQAEINRAANHNHLVDLMQQKIQTVIKMASPEERAEVAVAAVSAHYLTAQLKSANAKIKNLEAELGKISVVNSDTEKVKSPTRRNNPEKLVDLDDAMAAHFAR